MDLIITGKIGNRDILLTVGGGRSVGLRGVGNRWLLRSPRIVGGKLDIFFFIAEQPAQPLFCLFDDIFITADVFKLVSVVLNIVFQLLLLSKQGIALVLLVGEDCLLVDDGDDGIDHHAEQDQQFDPSCRGHAFFCVFFRLLVMFCFGNFFRHTNNLPV